MTFHYMSLVQLCWTRSQFFLAKFPDLTVTLDHLRVAGNHLMFGRVLTGTHSETGKSVSVPGREEWALGENQMVKSSLGFKAIQYDR